MLSGPVYVCVFVYVAQLMFFIISNSEQHIHANTAL